LVRASAACSSFVKRAYLEIGIEHPGSDFTYNRVNPVPMGEQTKR
jgi:hypothetical protein